MLHVVAVVTNKYINRKEGVRRSISRHEFINFPHRALHSLEFHSLHMQKTCSAPVSPKIDTRISKILIM
jgi:hypothetical protein